MSEYIKISECGSYGLKANSELWANINSKFPYLAGYIMNADDGGFENAIDQHEEDMRCLMMEWEE